MTCECEYFFLVLVESRREELMSHISPTHCPGNRGYLLFFSMVTVSCMKSSQGGGGELRVQSQQCMASIEAGHKRGRHCPGTASSGARRGLKCVC